MNQVYDPPIKLFKGTKKRVKNLLIKYPEMRDDLELVITTCWYNDIKAIANPNEVSMIEFLKLYRSGNLTPAETIRRSWQYLQENYIDLRGNNFNKRHKIADQVSKTIVL